mgnify:CR=1 FL=1
MVQFDPSEITGLENPNDITTIKKLTNPMEIGGEGHNAPKQIGEALKSTNTGQDNFYSGFISHKRQYAIKHCFLKEFQRVQLTGSDIDKRNFPLYSGLLTLAAKMALLELQTSNSIEGRFSNNMISALTGAVQRTFNRVFGKEKKEELQ